MTTPLKSLLTHIPDIIHSNEAAAQASCADLVSDSRKVTKGALFVAVRGAASDGSQFIASAVSAGAGVVVSESAVPKDFPAGAGYVQVKNSRAAISALAAAWFPAQPKFITAVTGTDGKTSTADFFRQIAALAGKKAASIGTLGVLGSAKEYPALNTTPDPILLHKMLSELAAEGVTHASLEASSHGLDQYRLHGVKLRAAAFTNLTRDHLDYHGTTEAYFEAKLKLFTEVLGQGGVAVINADSPFGKQVEDAVKSGNAKPLTYGKTAKDLVIREMTPGDKGITVKAELFGQTRDFVLPMIGSFQVYNFLAALGMATACEISVDAILSNIGGLKGVPGRLEHVAAHPINGANVYIDYAHTPAALENILKIIRPHVTGRLHVVFGCGGDRDKGKRPEMGRAAVSLADHVVVTDDNPRSEVPEVIRKEIVAPINEADMQKVKIIGDRKEAIAFAIRSLQKGDGLVIAGKGHERSQIIAGVSHPFDDAEVARTIVQAMKN